MYMSHRKPIRIDLDSPVPAYRQLADSVRKSLLAGDLAPGSMLPPVRRLALDLGLHHNTVARAYRELAEEGWLNLTRGRGAEVLDRPTPTASEQRAIRLRQDLETLISRARADGVSDRRIAETLRRSAESLSKESQS